MRDVPKGKNGLIFLRRRLYYGKQDRKLSDTIVKKENKMKRMMGVLAGALAAAGILCGCGESVDENKPIAEVRADPIYAKVSDDEAQRMIGEIKYVDVNGDHAITTEDRVVIGDTNPDFIYGLNLNGRWKNLSLGLFFQGSQGNDIFN